MSGNKIQELKNRIESILSGSNRMNEYDRQVTAEAIIQVLIEEGVLKLKFFKDKNRDSSEKLI